MPRLVLVLCCALGALAIGAATAQTPAAPPPMLRMTFDDNEQGWTAMGNTAKTTIAHDAANVKTGTGALKFDYGVNKGEVNILMLMATVPVPATARMVRFWVKTDYDATLGFVVQEREPGGRYMAPFFAPAGKWQQIEIALNDMILSDGKDDPKDPDGKLDIDQIAGCGLIDAGQMFIQGGDAALAQALNVKSGTHTLYLDDFTVSGAQTATAGAAAPVKGLVDDFVRPQANWLVLGRVSVSIGSGVPMTGRYLKAEYHVGPAAIMALSHGVKPGALTGMKKLSFSAYASKAAKLLVQVEETDGGKYNALVDIKGGGSPDTIGVTFADFTAADDSKDTNGKLDIELIKSVTIIDATGMIGGPEQDNTLWIGPIVGS